MFIRVEHEHRKGQFVHSVLVAEHGRVRFVEFPGERFHNAVDFLGLTSKLKRGHKLA